MVAGTSNVQGWSGGWEQRRATTSPCKFVLHTQEVRELVDLSSGAVLIIDEMHVAIRKCRVHVQEVELDEVLRRDRARSAVARAHPGIGRSIAETCWWAEPMR